MVNNVINHKAHYSLSFVEVKMISKAIASFTSAPQQKRPPNAANTNINALSTGNLQVETLVASNGVEMLQRNPPDNLQRTED